ncbi:MAG: S-layer homology domain-containing protein, partial [Oscillospiraceae bacterium]|nr:S-layer homology domain-containing protein [Oscillospiraceae bacterium]
DIDDVSPYATDAVLWAVQNGILDTDGNMLFPDKYVSRAETAEIIMKLSETVAIG